MPHSPRPARFVERFMRIRWIVAGLVVCSLCGGELPLDLRRLVGLAAALPAEFHSDALLQMVESRGGNMDIETKKELLEQAAAMAGRAKYAYPKVIARGVNADSREAFEANVLALKLDRLSLEMRAIRNLLAVNPMAARVLFQQLQKPTSPVGTCSDALVPQLEDYYDVGAQIVSRGFTAKEISREEHVALALQIVTGVKAVHEVGPAARMIVTARLTPPQFEAALNAFTARLEAIAVDERAFAETGLATQQEIASLASRTEDLGLSRGTLARAYRKFLVSHYGGARCADSPGRLSTVEWFNQSALRGDLALIEEKEMGRELGARAQVNAYWAGTGSEKILVTAQGLRTSPAGTGYSVPERQSTEWVQKLQDFLAQLTEWKQSGDESAMDFFNQKATVYESLIDVCPSGDGRQRLINAFGTFLNNSNASSSAPVDWFWHAQNMYRRLRQAGDMDAARLMAAYRASGNLILTVFAIQEGQP